MPALGVEKNASVSLSQLSCFDLALYKASMRSCGTIPSFDGIVPVSVTTRLSQFDRNRRAVGVGHISSRGPCSKTFKGRSAKSFLAPPAGPARSVQGTGNRPHNRLERLKGQDAIRGRTRQHFWVRLSAGVEIGVIYVHGVTNGVDRNGDEFVCR